MHLIRVLNQVHNLGHRLLSQPMLFREHPRQLLEVIPIPHINLNLLPFSQVEVKSEQ